MQQRQSSDAFPISALIMMTIAFLFFYWLRLPSTEPFAFVHDKSSQIQAVSVYKAITGEYYIVINGTDSLDSQDQNRRIAVLPLSSTALMSVANRTRLRIQYQNFYTEIQFDRVSDWLDQLVAQLL